MHKLLENSSWLLADKLSKLFPGVIVMACIAKYLGPEQFGIWNYALALTTIVGSIAVLSMDKIAVKELVNLEEQQGIIMATVFFMRLTTAVVCTLVSIGIVQFSRHSQPLYFYCTFFSSVLILLQSFDVFDYFYQSIHQVKRVIIPKVTVFLAFCAIKLLVIYFKGTIIFFLWISVIELIITYSIIIAVYWFHYGSHQPLKVNFNLVKLLLTKSWPLVLSSLVIMLFMKIDLVLLDALANPVILGQYVSAVKISELWYAIPSVLSIAILPVLLKQKKAGREDYMNTLEKWIRLSFWLSFFISLLITVTANFIILFLYGQNYAAASQMLMIHIWASIPAFTSIVIVQYLFIEGEYKVYLLANISGLITNIIANLFLIPYYGGVGSAIATVLAYIIFYSVLVTLDKSRFSFSLTMRAIIPSLVLADLKQVSSSLKISAKKQGTLN